MGHEVRIAAAATAAFAFPAAANSAPPAAGVEVFYSSDAEETEVLKTAIAFDLSYAGPEKLVGMAVERARYRPLGQDAKTMARVFLRAADSVGEWKWKASVGTDGDTLIGSATVHDGARFRKELFVERDIVETPIGVDRGIYYTFAGATIDLPADEGNVVTLIAGMQAFTGNNVRTHLRGHFVHVVKAEWGLSAQLRTRYFRSSHPGEYDYYSPRWYAEVLPVIQMRRFVGGWQLLAAAGYGAQRDSGSKWRSSGLLNARVTSPAFKRDWAVTGALLYANTPVGAGLTYRYFQVNLGLTKAF